MAARAAAPDKGAGLRPLRLRPQAEGTTAILSEMLARFIGDVRRNHALEHATVSLLISRLGPDLRLIGRASGDGFFIYGDVPSDLLSECAQEGLARLKRGEAFWAVTPLCGTNLATAGVRSEEHTSELQSRLHLV